jgi:hypothetical protein
MDVKNITRERQDTGAEPRVVVLWYAYLSCIRRDLLYPN